LLACLLCFEAQLCRLANAPICMVTWLVIAHATLLGAFHRVVLIPGVAIGAGFHARAIHSKHNATV
jgi:hypothetical protein